VYHELQLIHKLCVPNLNFFCHLFLQL